MKFSYSSAWIAILGSENMKGKFDLVVGTESVVGGLRRFNQSIVAAFLCKSANLAQVTHFAASEHPCVRACFFRGTRNSEQQLCSFLKQDEC